MNAKLFGILMVLIIGFVGIASAADTMVVTANLPASSSISIVNNMPSPWMLSKTLNGGINIVDNAVTYTPTSDVAFNTMISMTNGGYLKAGANTLATPLKINDPARTLTGTNQILYAGDASGFPHNIPLKQIVVSEDIPANGYAGTITFTIEAVV